jgi:hypothetical protein
MSIVVIGGTVLDVQVSEACSYHAELLGPPGTV